MSEGEETSWLTITLTGASAGIQVASLAYVAGSAASGIVSKTTGYTMNILGTIASIGTRFLFGDTASHSVKALATTFAHTSEANVHTSALLTTGAVAAGAGAITALSITIGTKIIEYSITYGGKISREIALKLAEAYLQYKLSYSAPAMDERWFVVESNGATSLQSFPPEEFSSAESEESEESEESAESDKAQEFSPANI